MIMYLSIRHLNLHSNLVIFKFGVKGARVSVNSNLHSNLVIFKYKLPINTTLSLSSFTFQSGDIQIKERANTLSLT